MPCDVPNYEIKVPLPKVKNGGVYNLHLPQPNPNFNLFHVFSFSKFTYTIYQCFKRKLLRFHFNSNRQNLNDNFKLYEESFCTVFIPIDHVKIKTLRGYSAQSFVCCGWSSSPYTIKTHCSEDNSLPLSLKEDTSTCHLCICWLSLLYYILIFKTLTGHICGRHLSMFCDKFN